MTRPIALGAYYADDPAASRDLARMKPYERALLTQVLTQNSDDTGGEVDVAVHRAVDRINRNLEMHTIPAVV